MNEIKYTLVTAPSEEQLVTAVNNMISEGYTPIGGVACLGATTQFGNVMGRHYYQAMILEEKKKKSKKIVDNIE